MNAIPLRRDVYYPESDGQPMAETGLHVQAMVDLLSALWTRYEGTPDVYVGGNQFLYYVEGNPRMVVAPDVFVVKGVPSKPPRRIYKLWEERQPPCLVVELTSDSTRKEDLESKKLCYEQMGVEEYLLFDVLGDYLKPSLQGFRLVDGRYRRIEPLFDGSLLSRPLGLRFHADGPNLRLVDAETGEPLVRATDMPTQESRLRAEKERADRMEEELARLRRELEQARGE